MSRGSLLLWIRHAPHSTGHFAEGVRVGTMAVALGTPVRLLFIGDGVRVLAAHQEAYRLGPPVDKTLRDLVSPESPALVHGPSLDRRGLRDEDLAPGVPVRRIDSREAALAVLESSRTVPL